MALRADLSVNGLPIGFVYARRVSPQVERPYPDDVCIYEWIIRKDNERLYSEEPLYHRYGDGAFILIAKIIEVAKEVSS